MVNPVDICAVPWKSAEYGKLRCCAYLPIGIAEYDDTGHVIPFRTDSGFEEPYVTTILYDGAMNPETSPTYTIPTVEERNMSGDYRSVSDKILDIARQYMKKRT